MLIIKGMSFNCGQRKWKFSVLCANNVRMYWGALLLLLLALIVGGCSRSYYRKQADKEVYGAVQEKNQDDRRKLKAFNVDPPKESRLHDATNRDKPPPPPDDPKSHELLKQVNGMKGARVWEKRGGPVPVDQGQWRQYLPTNGAGSVVLNLTNTVRVALNNSRTYQQEKEDLFLSALDVTLERFRLDAQYALGGGLYDTITDRHWAGNKDQIASKVTGATKSAKGSASKVTAMGGELVLGIANEITWNLRGSGQDTFASVINFSVTQPLLRGAGRAKILEKLTLSERRLLANVRQMCQYQQGFFVELITGRTGGDGPARTGVVGGTGLGVIAGTPTGRTGAPDVSGYLGLIQERQLVVNQEANVAALRQSHAQLQSAFEAGRLTSRLQVDQALQALYRGQSSLLSARAGYKTRIDAFKITVGLPPDLDLEVGDALFDRFTLVDPAITDLQNRADEIQRQLRDKEHRWTLAEVKKQMEVLGALRAATLQQWEEAQGDVIKFREVIPIRRAQLRRLQKYPEVAQAGLDSRMFNEDNPNLNLKHIEQVMERLKKSFAGVWEKWQTLQAQADQVQPDELGDGIADLALEIASLLLELSLNQASARLEAVALPEVEITAEKALAIAQENRLDWMNARATLVDAWRKVETDANALLSDVEVTLDGELRTRDNDPSNFDPRNSQLRMGLHVDTPVTRLAERNVYRQTLIDYQKARRDYLLFADRIQQSLRNSVRLVYLTQVNFEIRRAAVEAAIRQVDLAGLRLTEPPRPGVQAVFGATTARDLLSALTDLLDAQNDFLKTWMNYYMLRLVMDFELGTMNLDEAGLWKDPGAIKADELLAHSPEKPPAVPGLDEKFPAKTAKTENLSK